MEVKEEKIKVDLSEEEYARVASTLKTPAIPEEIQVPKKVYHLELDVEEFSRLKNMLDKHVKHPIHKHATSISTKALFEELVKKFGTSKIIDAESVAQFFNGNKINAGVRLSMLANKGLIERISLGKYKIKPDVITSIVPKNGTSGPTVITPEMEDKLSYIRGENTDGRKKR